MTNETTAQMLTTAERLETILSAIEDAPLREDLFHRFFLENPLQVAKLLHSLNLSDSVKSQLLALKVGMPPSYKGADLEPLIEHAMQQMWARIGEDRAD